METIVALVESQRKEIERVNARVAQLEAENRELAQRVTVMSDTVSAMETRERTAYVAIGMEQELLDARVVSKEVGTKVLLWRPGQTLVPTRDPPRGAFRTIDIVRDRVLELPKDGSAYRIVSKHSAILTNASDGELVRNRLEVRDPERFWEVYRYLILVRQ